jgi:plastocyanin
MRRSVTLPILLGVAVIITGTACSSDNSGPSVTGDVLIVQGASNLTTTAFSPNPFTESIATKNTVIWANKDNVTHHIVSDTPLFDSQNLPGGNTFTYTFTAPGTYTYHCSIHPGMVGTIQVNP